MLLLRVIILHRDGFVVPVDDNVGVALIFVRHGNNHLFEVASNDVVKQPITFMIEEGCKGFAIRRDAKSFVGHLHPIERAERRTSDAISTPLESNVGALRLDFIFHATILAWNRRLP